MLESLSRKGNGGQKISHGNESELLTQNDNG